MGKIIDVSEFQGTINWSEASSEVSLAILRAQDGDEDKQFARNVRECKGHGVPFGVYAFFRAKTPAAGTAEAVELLARTAQRGGGARFYVLDCEIDGLTPAAIKAGVRHLQSKGCKVGLYIAHHQWSKYGVDYGQDFTWVPRYGHRPNMPCDLWQYTSSGKVRGIKGNVDINCINGSLPLSWFIRKPSPRVPVPAPKPKPKSTPKLKVYTVKKGDTLSGIAHALGTNVKTLVKINGIKDADLIYPKQKIKYPA